MDAGHHPRPAGVHGGFRCGEKAVEDGKITEQRIDDSVRRILKLKHGIRR